MFRKGMFKRSARQLLLLSRISFVIEVIVPGNPAMGFIPNITTGFERYSDRSDTVPVRVMHSSTFWRLISSIAEEHASGGRYITFAIVLMESRKRLPRYFLYMA